MQRRAEFRPFSWLHDLWKREQLDLDPPYQRRSVWTERFKTDFVTTVLLNYPCPAIFLYEEIRPDGSFLYKVVDGKQRLTTLFDFVTDKIPINEQHPKEILRGKLFSSLEDDQKVQVWRYSFSVEFVPQESEAIINDIFNRINMNVAKLTHQELRHARFSGAFISSAEKIAGKTLARLPQRFPNIAPQSQRQMKDVEFVATLLLFLEQGERSTSQAELDSAFAEREEEWPNQQETVHEYNEVVDYISRTSSPPDGNDVASSRLKNQADFYSLFAAVAELHRAGTLPESNVAAERLSEWVQRLQQVERREIEEDGMERELQYLAAVRAASNDSGPRRRRIDALKSVIAV